MNWKNSDIATWGLLTVFWGYCMKVLLYWQREFNGPDHSEFCGFTTEGFHCKFAHPSMMEVVFSFCGLCGIFVLALMCFFAAMRILDEGLPSLLYKKISTLPDLPKIGDIIYKLNDITVEKIWVDTLTVKFNDEGRKIIINGDKKTDFENYYLHKTDAVYERNLKLSAMIKPD